MKFYELYNMLPSGIREGKYSAFIKVFSNFTVVSIDVYSDTLQVVLI